MDNQSKGYRNILIAVAWPYVNGEIHIGHLAGYLLPADIAARYHRFIGDNVLMVSGSDCHGTPITVEADKKGQKPQEIADEYHAKDVVLFKDVLKLTYDLYTRTDTNHHIKITQDFFVKMYDEGYIYIDRTEQYYSDQENRFLPDRYVEGSCPFCNFNNARSDQCDNCGKFLDQGELINPISKISKSTVYLKTTEHYFVDWAKLAPDIEKFVDKNGPNWKEWVFQETKGWLAEGLKARPVSRDIDWGVPIPIDRIPKDAIIEHVENKRLYVWFDAVIGYYSASLLWAQQNNMDWQPFWLDEIAHKNNQTIKHYYFMGKDNLAFHTMLWPGKLIAFDKKLHLPDVESINMFLNLEGKQFSKSRGVVIDSKKFVEKFGNDKVRFYLTYIMPEVKDSSFSWSDFQLRVNNILIGNFGNLIHRTLSIYFNNLFDLTTETLILEPEVEQEITQSYETVNSYLENCEFKNYLDTILQLSAFGNRYFDYHKIWQLAKINSTEFEQKIYNLFAIILACGIFSQPLLIELNEKLPNLLGITLNAKWPNQQSILTEIRAKIKQIKLNQKPYPLFTRIEDTDLNLD